VKKGKGNKDVKPRKPRQPRKKKDETTADVQLVPCDGNTCPITGQSCESKQEVEITPCANLADLSQWNNDVNDADKGKIVVTDCQIIDVVFTFPLAHPCTFRMFNSTPGFTEGAIVNFVSSTYQHIYKQEDEDNGSPALTNQDTGDRMTTNGRFGIGKYFLKDLTLSKLICCKYTGGKVCLHLTVNGPQESNDETPVEQDSEKQPTVTDECCDSGLPDEKPTEDTTSNVDTIDQ